MFLILIKIKDGESSNYLDLATQVKYSSNKPFYNIFDYLHTFTLLLFRIYPLDRFLSSDPKLNNIITTQIRIRIVVYVLFFVKIYLLSFLLFATFQKSTAELESGHWSYVTSPFPYSLLYIISSSFAH